MKINKRTLLRKARLAKKGNNLGFELPFTHYYTSMTDYALGADYITRFFNSANNTARQISAYTYVITLRDTLGSTIADSKIAGLGLGIRLAEMSESDVQSAADNLASLSNGQVPATIESFTMALIGQASSTPFTDAVVNSAVTKGFAAVGNTIITAADTVASLASSTVEGAGMMAKLISYVPWVLPIGIGYAVYKFYGGGLIKSLLTKK